MAQHHGAATHGAVRANGRTAGHAHTARHGGVGTDAHVVADLDQVVELDAVFNHGVVQRTAVDAGVGTNLHVVANAHRAELLDLHPPTIVRRKAKSIGTDHHARVHDAARTEVAGIAERHARVQQRVLTHGGTGAEHGVSANPRAARHAGTRSDQGKRADIGRSIDVCVGVNAGQWIDPRRGCRRMLSPPPLRETRKVQVGVGCDDAGTSRLRRLPQAVWDDQRRRLGAVDLAGVARLRHKGQLTGLCGDQWRQPMDGQRRVSKQFAAESLNHGAQRLGHLQASAYLRLFKPDSTLSVMSCLGLM